MLYHVNKANVKLRRVLYIIYFYWCSLCSASSMIAKNKVFALWLLPCLPSTLFTLLLAQKRCQTLRLVLLMYNNRTKTFRWNQWDCQGKLAVLDLWTVVDKFVLGGKWLIGWRGNIHILQNSKLQKSANSKKCHSLSMQ